MPVLAGRTDLKEGNRTERRILSCGSALHLVSYGGMGGGARMQKNDHPCGMTKEAANLQIKKEQ